MKVTIDGSQVSIRRDETTGKYYVEVIAANGVLEDILHCETLAEARAWFSRY